MARRSRKYERLGSTIAALPAQFLINLALRLPTPIVHAIAEIFGRLFWLVGVPWRRLAMRNLRLVYRNTRTDRELRAIAKQSMINVVRMVVEMTAFFRPPYTAVKEMPIQGEEYLKRALADGKPVLLLGSHVGNFVLLIFVLSQR